MCIRLINELKHDTFQRFLFRVYTIIWYSIIQRFEEQKANLTDCEYVTKMPREVNFIVWSQAGLFALFGAAQTVQTLYTLGVKDRKYLTYLNPRGRWQGGG